MKLIFIAPLTSIGGHSLISNILYLNLKKKFSITPIDLSKASNHYGKFSIKRILMVAILLFKVLKNKKNADRIYITISQSLLGNLKDLIIFLILFNKFDKTILHLHGGSIGENLFKKIRIIKLLNLFFYKNCKKIIISGKSHYSIFPKELDKKLTIIQNFASDKLFNNYKDIKIKFQNSNPIRILFLSNMLPEKGYMHLLNGFKLLNKKSRKPLILEFAGKFYNNKLKSEFIDLVSKEKDIFYHGSISNKKKKELLHKAHIFCLPTSFLEGQPISILEAYASGCFVLTSDKPGINDIFKNGKNGFSLNKIDPKIIKFNLEKILIDFDLCEKIGIENRKIAGKYFREKKYLKSIEKSIL
tara:strand:+ start:21745 stop:22818 length:1074 start_codon:yes stop_codon:yes gene_type:complete